jgi:peroxiredoxin
VELNQLSPDFELPDLEGRRHGLADFRGRIVIINFWSCGCPHSERTDRALMDLFVQWHSAVALIAIASNRIESVEALAEAARTRRLPAVLVDREHLVADLYEAQTTPQVFLVDRAGILRYRGALDDVTFGKRKPTRCFLDEAVQALMNGQLPAVAETRPYGCAIVREAVE